MVQFLLFVNFGILFNENSYNLSLGVNVMFSELNKKKKKKKKKNDFLGDL